MGKLTLGSDTLIRELKGILYKSCKDTGERLGLTQNFISSLCARGRVKGAYKVSGVWLVPHNFEYSKRKRKKKKRKKYIGLLNDPAIKKKKEDADPYFAHKQFLKERRKVWLEKCKLNSNLVSKKENDEQRTN